VGADGIPGTGAIPASDAVGGYIDTSAVNATRTALIANGLVSVRQYGAVGDGVTDDTNAINAAIQANPGRTIYFPAKTYLIDATANLGNRDRPVGIQLNVPGVTLLLDTTATLTMIPNAAERYAIIAITAADCSVIGGTIIGDVGAHLGATGEWGYGIVINEGGDRALIERTRITKCWGDGIMVGDGTTALTGILPTDIRIVGVDCDDNRRQGLSVVAARRLRVIGGLFRNTGRTAYTSPGAGIDFEPNLSPSLEANIDLLVVGAVFDNNKGSGFTANASGRPNSITVSSCRSVNNDQGGFTVIDEASRVDFTGCTATGNGLSGFYLDGKKNSANSCVAIGNTKHGFEDLGVENVYTGCTARDNQLAGFLMNVGSIAPFLNGVISVGNAQGSWFREIQIYSPGAVLVACFTNPGTGAKQSVYGIAVMAGATGVSVLNCASTGYPALTNAFAPQADTIAVPVPGAVGGVLGATTGTTAPAAGGAGALPATPLGYMTVRINGVDRKMPYYA
jgi:hypothetical protein